ncbi:MAG: AI-2E family transporter [Alteromonadaceae bacterium]|nr:AI-2E family transporter [Alteromonadaceae bacterium]
MAEVQYSGEPPQQERRRRRSATDRLETPLYGLFVLGILYTLYVAHGVILPVLLALLTSLLMAPVVRVLRRRLRIPPAVSALVLIAAFLGALGGLTWTVSQPLLEWAGKAPESFSKLALGQSSIKTTIEQVTRSAEEVEETVDGLSEEKVTTVVLQQDSWRQKLFAKAQEGLAGLALAMALSYFLLVNGDRLIQNLARQLPRHARRRVLHMIRDSQEEIAKYLGIISLSNTLVGVLTGLMTWAIGLPSPVVWGVVAGLTRFVPYLGVIITIALLAVVSIASLDEIWLMSLAPLGFLALTSLVGFFLEPFIHGFRMSINPILIFISIFFWGWLWGPVGVLLAVPLMTVIQVVLKQIPKLRPVYKVIAR